MKRRRKGKIKGQLQRRKLKETEKELAVSTDEAIASKY